MTAPKNQALMDLLTLTHAKIAGVAGEVSGTIARRALRPGKPEEWAEELRLTADLLTGTVPAKKAPRPKTRKKK